MTSSLCLTDISGLITAIYSACTLCLRKSYTTFTHHSLASVRHRVVWFSANSSETNCLHDNVGQCLNTAIKYSLFCNWQVIYLNTELTTKSLRQIHGVNKVCAKPAFQDSEKWFSVCPPWERITDDNALINERLSTVKWDILLFKCRWLHCWLWLHRISASAKPKFGHFSQIRPNSSSAKFLAEFGRCQCNCSAFS